MFEAVFEDEKLKKRIQKFYDTNRGLLGFDKYILRKYTDVLSIFVYRDIIDHFENEEGFSGKWAKWSDSYKEYLEQKGYAGNKILQFSGKLRQNFLPTSNRTTNKGILWFNNAKTRTGFPYAFAHNEGGDKLPKRDFMWLSPWAMDSIEDATVKFMMDEK